MILLQQMPFVNVLSIFLESYLWLIISIEDRRVPSSEFWQKHGTSEQCCQVVRQNLGLFERKNVLLDSAPGFVQQVCKT